MDDEYTMFDLPVNFLRSTHEPYAAARTDNDTHYCYSFRPQNSSIPVIIPGGFEGIPQNLLINIIAWMVKKKTHSLLISIYQLHGLFFYILVLDLVILHLTEKCLELWKDGPTPKKRTKV